MSVKNEWTWDISQQEAFVQVKEEFSNSPVVALYNLTVDNVIFADASSYGLGAILMQKQPDHQWKPIAYVSRSLTPTGITWACGQFSE